MGRGRFKGGLIDQHTYHFGEKEFQSLYSAEMTLREGICPRDGHRWKRVGPAEEQCTKCPIRRTWNPEKIRR